MKKLGSMVVVGLLLAGCAQQPPQAPPPQSAPPPPTPGCPCEAMGHEHPGGPMEHGPGMRGEHERRFARHHEAKGPREHREAIRELAMLGVRLYPPPMLIRRATDIGLTPDQVAKIRQEVLTTQARSVDLKAKIDKAKVESMRLLAADKVDERGVGAQIDEASKAAAELRKLQVGMMLRVRDVLTPEQLKKLQERKPPGPEGKPGKQAMDDDDDDDDDDEDES